MAYQGFFLHHKKHVSNNKMNGLTRAKSDSTTSFLLPQHDKEPSNTFSNRTQRTFIVLVRAAKIVD